MPLSLEETGKNAHMTHAPAYLLISLSKNVPSLLEIHRSWQRPYFPPELCMGQPLRKKQQLRSVLKAKQNPIVPL